MAGLATLATGLSSYSTIDQQRKNVYLTPLNKNGQVDGEVVAFQYFPESLTDSKAVNWQTKEIPGGSLPLYQWTSSGERTVSFTAYFTSDIDATAYMVDFFGLSSEQSVSGAENLKNRLKSNGVERRNFDVRSAVTWVRQYMLPTYGNGPSQTIPPPILQLYIPNSGLGMAGGYVPGDQASDAINCVMTQCEVTWEKFFPSGYPRIASVSLAFAQVAQTGDAVRFPRRMISDSVAGPTPVDIGGVVYLGYAGDRAKTSGSGLPSLGIGGL